MPQIELKIKRALSMLGMEWQGVAGKSPLEADFVGQGDSVVGGGEEPGKQT